MKFLESPFSHHHKSAPVVAANMSIDAWSHQLSSEPTKLVRKIDMCTADTSGKDAWGTPVDKTHLHTLLRVSLAPASSGPGGLGEVYLIERVLSTAGAHHSVTPIPEMLSSGGTLFHPEVHDRICIASDGPSSGLAHHLEVERTLVFGEGSSSSPRLTIGELGQVLGFVGRATRVTCSGGDCKFQSRSFSFTCMAALTSSLPPCTPLRGPGERVDMNVKSGPGVEDTEFELEAVTFLGQAPWLLRDAESVKALRLIESLRNQPRANATVRLYH